MRLINCWLLAHLIYIDFEFILILLNNSLIEIGEEFCGSKSEELYDLIRRHSISYFKTYHANRLEELRIFLENESWELCPVKQSFNILQLQVFHSNTNLTLYYY